MTAPSARRAGKIRSVPMSSAWDARLPINAQTKTYGVGQ